MALTEGAHAANIAKVLVGKTSEICADFPCRAAEIARSKKPDRRLT